MTYLPTDNETPAQRRRQQLAKSVTSTNSSSDTPHICDCSISAGLNHLYRRDDCPNRYRSVRR